MVVGLCFSSLCDILFCISGQMEESKFQCKWNGFKG